jgi:hypothetical protein
LRYSDALGLCRCKADPYSKKYPGPNGSNGVKTGLILGYSTLVKCTYSCKAQGGKSENVVGTQNVETWFSPGETDIVCYAVTYKEVWKHLGEGQMVLIHQVDKALSFDPRKSPIPELRDWADKNCKDCEQ